VWENVKDRPLNGNTTDVVEAVRVLIDYNNDRYRHAVALRVFWDSTGPAPGR
jgi:hypothetical protein